AGFPNFFMMYGPNTNLGHNSIIFMLECQTRYILGAIRTLIARDLLYLDVDPEVMRTYDEGIQAELADTAWPATGQDGSKTEAGRISKKWSGSTLRYWWTTRRFDREHYRVQPSEGASRAAAAVAKGEAAAA